MLPKATLRRGMGNGSGVGHVGERQQSGLTTILSSCSEAGHCLCFQGTPGVGTPPPCLVSTASFDVTSPIDMMSSVSLPHSPLCGSLSSGSSWTWLQNALQGTLFTYGLSCSFVDKTPEQRTGLQVGFHQQRRAGIQSPHPDTLLPLIQPQMAFAWMYLPAMD